MKNKYKSFLLLTVFALLMVGCDTTNSNSQDNKNAARIANKNERKQAKENKEGNKGLTREDFDKEVEHFKKEAKEAGGKIGSGADDLWIWTKTRAALAYADDLRDSTIAVDVNNNVVTLTGSVANATQKTRAEEIAKEIGGVKSLKNLLQVSAAEDASKKTKEKK
jgi:osmotically-inducible protein OsmY